MKEKYKGSEYEILYEVGGYIQFIESLLCKSVLFCVSYNIQNILEWLKQHHPICCYERHTERLIGTSLYRFRIHHDMMAEKSEWIPFEFRYKNIARPGDLTCNNRLFHEYPMETLMDMPD